MPLGAIFGQDRSASALSNSAVFRFPELGYRRIWVDLLKRGVSELNVPNSREVRSGTICESRSFDADSGQQGADFYLCKTCLMIAGIKVSGLFIPRMVYCEGRGCLFTSSGLFISKRDWEFRSQYFFRCSKTLRRHL